MSELESNSFRRTSLFFALAMGAIVIASASIAWLVQRQGSVETESRHFEAQHLRSLAVANRVAVELISLGVELDRPVGIDPKGSEFRAGPILRAMQSIRADIAVIVDLEHFTERPELPPAVRRVQTRFERLESALASPADGGATGDADSDALIASLSLAVEQLSRLELIAANSAIESGELRAADRTRTLFLWGTGIGVLALLASAGILFVLRRGFERENEMRAAIDRSREQTLHSQKLEALGTLSGGVAHDFNNLLTVIIGHAELLGARQGIDATVVENVGAIERAAEQAASLTRQLLAFSRQEIGEPRVVQLNSIVESTEAMLRRLLGADVALLTHLDPGLVAVNADPSQIEQVIVNLVVNARDAMPEGGTATLETANTVLDPDTDPASDTAQRYARLSVRDTGLGIPAEFRDRIFEPFFSTKGRGEGTGLGLSTVHGIVSRGGGLVSAIEQPDGGTRFDTYFPESHRPVTVDDRSRQTSRQTGSETILLVEDHAQVRAFAASVLRDAGYQVIEAVDGVEALQICRERKAPIQLILTDVVMPEIKGHELVERAKSSHPEARVLFMSGYTDDVILRSGFRQDPDQLIQKPFRRDDLLLRVRRALDADPASR